MFNDFFGNLTPDFYYDENDDFYIYQIPIPGVKKEEIKMSVNNDGIITIKISENKYYKSLGDLIVGFKSDVDRNKDITSKLENGILAINIPKVKKEIKEIKID